jgi:hypothetical protein
MPQLVPQTQNGFLTDHQRGTNDTFIDFTFFYGDASYMYDDSRGGNDTLTGGDFSTENILLGDAGNMSDMLSCLGQQISIVTSNCG